FNSAVGGRLRVKQILEASRSLIVKGEGAGFMFVVLLTLALSYETSMSLQQLYQGL
ncbi:unnamed protein product, partial [Durusdinium trenchii]